MPQTFDYARSPLEREPSETIKATLRGAALPHSLPVGDDGLVAPIDHDIHLEPSLNKVAIDGLSAKMSRRFADGISSEFVGRLNIIEADRRYFGSLRERFAELVFLRYESTEQERIHALEVAAGWYTVDRDVSQKQAASQQAWAESTKEVMDIFHRLTQDQAFDALVRQPRFWAHLRATTAIAAVVSMYKNVHSANTNNIGNWDPKHFLWVLDPISNSDRPPKFQSVPPGDGINWSSLPDWLYQSVRMAASAELTCYSSSLRSQIRSSTGANAAAVSDRDARNLVASWNAADVEFRRQRTALGVRLNAMRSEAMTPGGGLDLVGEMSRVREVCHRNIADLVARCQVVAQGFTHLWAIDLPPPPLPYEWGAARKSYIAELGAWVSDVGRVLLPFVSRETSTVLPLSIRELLGESAWKKVLAEYDKEASVSFSFRLDPSDGPSGWWATRLKGVSAFVAGPDSTHCWRGRLRLPLHAVVVDQLGQLRAIQQDGQECDLARVLPRASMAAPDIVGLTLLRNLSPFSGAGDSGETTWRMTLNKPAGARMSTIKDVQLDLVLAGFCGEG